jgi:dihydroorotase
VLPVAAITKGLKGERLVEMGLLAEAGAAYFSDDGLPVWDTQVMRRALSYAGGFGLMVAQHAEDHRLAGCGCMNEGETATRLGLPGIPNAAETVIVDRDIRLVELTGGKARYHVAHISTAEAVEAVRQAKRRGLPVTAEVTPHHFTLDDRAIGDYRTFAKMAPPLRAARDVDAMIEGLADGTIDAIATDHAPHDQDSKRVPFAHAANGVVGLETMLPLTLELVRDGHISLLDAVAAMTLKPAELLGSRAGRLAKGAAADLVVFSTEHEWVLNAALLHSKSKNTPFDGRTLRGRALRTVVRGRTVFQLT